MDRLKLIVYTIVALCALGTIFTGGQVQGLFEQMLVLLVIFLLVVLFVPQLIVDEKKREEEAV